MKKLSSISLAILLALVLTTPAAAQNFLIAAGSASQSLGDTPVESDASCLATFTATGADALAYKVQCFNLTGVTQAHIHLGSAQESGPPVAFLFPLGDPTGSTDGVITRGDVKSKGTLAAADLLNGVESIADLLAILQSDGAYLNVHTEANAGGEVRGQITVVENVNNITDEFFVAGGTGSQSLTEPAGGIETDANCFASFRATANGGLKYRVRCDSITGVTQVHIHLGNAQTSGAAVAFLFPIGDATGDVSGLIKRDGVKSKGTLTDANLLNELEGQSIADLLALMRADGAYLNVHTDANPGGEVRGQIVLVETLGGGL